MDCSISVAGWPTVCTVALEPTVTILNIIRGLVTRRVYITICVLVCNVAVYLLLAVAIQIAHCAASGALAWPCLYTILKHSTTEPKYERQNMIICVNIPHPPPIRAANMEASSASRIITMTPQTKYIRYMRYANTNVRKTASR